MSDPELGSTPSESSPAKPGIKKRFGPLFMAVALAFVAYSAWDLAHRWQKTKVSLDLGWALASIVPLGVVFDPRARLDRAD